MNEIARPTLGVVAISYNEEQDLPGFIDNLVSWVDEIIIIDDGSNDRTQELALAAGPKINFIVSPREANQYFADQRNKGIEAATCDWLLHMDVDERVSAGLAREITEAIYDPNFDGYRYKRLNYFMHRPMKGGGWQDWNLVHLARRQKFHFRGMFHEECVLDAPSSRIGQLTHKMLHLNEDSLEKRFRKSATYSSEITKRIRARNRPVSCLDISGRPLVEFIRKYFLKRGFIDGVPGLISAAHSATAIFRANALIWEEQNQISRAALEKELREQNEIDHIRSIDQ